MGFTLLGKTYNNVGDVTFNGNPVDKLIYNGVTLWEHYPKWVGIAYSGLLSCGERAVDLTSNGISTNPVNAGYTWNMRCCCLHDGALLIGGEMGYPVISYTKSWENRSWNGVELGDTSGNVELLCSGGDICIAVVRTEAGDLDIYQTNDGVSWENAASALANTDDIHELRYINDKFYLCANLSLYSSADGKTWTLENTPTSGIRSVYNKEGLWLIATQYGMYGGYTIEQVAKLAEHVSWGEFFGRITSFNGMYFSGEYYYSEDGLNWIRNNRLKLTTEQTGTECVLYDGEKYYGFGAVTTDADTGKVTAQYYSTSDDGITWDGEKTTAPFIDTLLLY